MYKNKSLIHVLKQSTNGYKKGLSNEPVVQICPHTGRCITINAICIFACPSILFIG